MDGYNQNDLLLLIGQATVELAYLRRRVAELEAAQAKPELLGTDVMKPGPNGIAEVIPPVTAQ